MIFASGNYCHSLPEEKQIFWLWMHEKEKKLAQKNSFCAIAKHTLYVDSVKGMILKVSGQFG